MLEVLYHHANLVWLEFHPPPGWPKTLSFVSVCLLCVSLFVRLAFERQRLCARFRHEGVGAQKRFRCNWIGTGLYLCNRVQLCQNVANWRQHYMAKSKKTQKLGFFTNRERQNKPIDKKLGTYASTVGLL